MEVTPAFLGVVQLLTLVSEKLYNKNANKVLVIFDDYSSHLANEIIQKCDINTNPKLAWMTISLNRLVSDSSSFVVDDNPSIILVLEKSPYEAVELIENVFNNGTVHNQSVCLAIVHHFTSDSIYTQHYVNHAVRISRLLTIVVWWEGFIEEFDQPFNFNPPSLDYYFTYEPPQIFRAMEFGPANEKVSPSIGFGGEEVWLVQLITESMNRTVNYFLYEYEKYQDSDCFSCNYYDQHYSMVYRMNSVVNASYSLIGLNNDRATR